MPNILLSIFIYFFILLTGAAGLIYQVTWQKYLSRLLGSDSVATAIILATFLGGLSLGYYLCGKLTTRVKRHFIAYAFLEGIIGLWCLFFPYIFRSVDYFTKYWGFSPPIMIIFQGVLCSILLMGVPTICMGGTIPFLTRGISKNLLEATRVHATVYGVNTAGAFLGTLLAGFYLIPNYGLPATMVKTSILNLGAFFFFLILPKLLKQCRTLERTQRIYRKSDSRTFIGHRQVSTFSPLFYCLSERFLCHEFGKCFGSDYKPLSGKFLIFLFDHCLGFYTLNRCRKLRRERSETNFKMAFICQSDFYIDIFADHFYHTG